METKPGETHGAMIALDRRALFSCDTRVKRWVTEPGRFDVMVGSLSRDNRLKGGFEFFE